MHIDFIANDVSYNEALDGDIKQIHFDEDSEDDSFNPSKYYVHISMNYEFPPFTPTVEWFDGSESGGGADIVNYNLKKDSLQLWLNNSMSFYIDFVIEQDIFDKISDVFSNIDLKKSWVQEMKTE